MGLVVSNKEKILGLITSRSYKLQPESNKCQLWSARPSINEKYGASNIDNMLL